MFRTIIVRLAGVCLLSSSSIACSEDDSASNGADAATGGTATTSGGARGASAAGGGGGAFSAGGGGAFSTGGGGGGASGSTGSGGTGGTGATGGGVAGASTGGSTGDAGVMDASGTPGADGGVPDGGGDGSSGVDLVGTWVSQVTTSGKLMVPVVGMTDADIDLVIRLSLTRAAGKLNGNFEICRLTTTTPDPTSLKVTFTPTVLATLNAAVSEDDLSANVGEAVPIPGITIRSGIDAGGQAVDSDKDSNPGVTVPSDIGGVIQLNAYVGLTISVSLNGKLSAPDTLDGTTDFGTQGMVFGSDNPAALSSGTISVTPSSPSVPFSATRLAGDVACSDVVTRFPQ
jgi:hypothetical protein